MDKFYKILSFIKYFTKQNISYFHKKFYAAANEERECELVLQSDGETEKFKCKQKWRILGGVEMQCVYLDEY